MQVCGFVKKVLRNMFSCLMPPPAEGAAADAAAAVANDKVRQIC